MARASELGLQAVTIEGGLIAPELVQKIAAADRSPKLAASYDCPKGTSLGDEIARYFRIGQALWRDYDRIEAPTITQTAQFARDLLLQCFGFDDLAGPVDHNDGNRRFRLAWEGKAGRVPIVAAAPVQGREAFNFSSPEFGDGAGGGRARRSPVSLLQDWLNSADEALWGLVFAGDRVRLMRDNASLTRPAWIEADLGAMFRDEMFADFTAWWLLTHATRFGSAEAAPSECPLEDWRGEGLKQGVEARADLYKNVKLALTELGQGVVEANPDLRDKLGEHGAPTAFFEELLRTAYRLIFLAVAEDRELLHPRRTPQEARALYAGSYSFSFWRQRSRRRVARDAHHDAWEAMKITLGCLENGEELLGLPALGGLFAAGETPLMNGARISNRRFLSALFYLGFIVRDGATHRINWRDLKTEELGSVYEGLLEIRPVLSANDAFELDEGAKGNARKTSGSYYTPDSLVETLLDSALDPVLQKAEDDADTPEAKVAAILDLKVIDPACGSGHFLLGAARRMADRVAKLRNEDAGKEETQTALRDVVSRCIHGVDRNPMAVELAKVALWIESVSPGKPLGFLDGNIRCGDALLGVFDLAALEDGIPDEAYKPLTGDSKDSAKFYLKANRDAKRGQGSFDWGTGTGAMPPKRLAANLETIRRMPEDTVGQVEKKKAAFEAWRHDPARWSTRVACDLYVAAFLLPKTEVPRSDLAGTVPTTTDVRKKLTGGQVYGPLEGAAVDVAAAARLLHWPLAFPDVIITRGGFDVVLGNPPWEVVQLGEQEYFESRLPEIAEMKGAARKKAIADLERSYPEIFMEFARDKRRFEAINDFARACGRFDLTARGKVNTYGLFAEHFLNLTREGGRAGVIVPTGIATDATTAPFFGHLVSEQRLAGLTDFENSVPLFAGVHRSFKFSLLTIGSGVAAADFAFFLTDPKQLHDLRRRFILSPAEIARINPNTKTAPVFRSRHDAELTATIYNRVPVLVQEGLEDGNPWGVEFRQGLFNMTSDSRLFRNAAQLADAGFSREGTDWIGRGVRNPEPVRSGTQSRLSTAVALLDALDGESGVPAALYEDVERYVPLYEAKMVHQYNHRFGDGAKLRARPLNTGWPDATSAELEDKSFDVSPWYWINTAEVEKAFYERRWQQGWTFNWRRNARSTDERTLIADIIPRAGLGDNLFTAFLPIGFTKVAAFYANWNSLIVDHCLRQKAGGANMSFFLIEQLPILPPTAYSEADLAFIVPRVLELTYTSHSMAPFARDLGYEGPPFAWDEDRRAQLRAQLDSWYALAYGLTRDELRYVLDPKDVMGADYPSETFRVLQNNEVRKYGEYRTRRLVLAAYDELTAQGLRPHLEGYR
jgi:N-6 DNA Methylase